MQRLGLVTAALLMSVWPASASGSVNAGLAVAEVSPQGLTVRMSVDDLDVSAELEGDGFPVVAGWVALPPGTLPEVAVVERDAVPLESREVAETAAKFTAAGKVPSDRPVEVGRAVVFRGIALAPVFLFPVQLDRSAGERGMVLNRNLTVRVDFVPDEAAPKAAATPRRDYPEAWRWLGGLLLNPARDQAERQFDHLAHILILYPQGLDSAQGVAWVDSLANWKRQMGYKVSVEAVNPNSTAQNIRQFVRNNYFIDAEDPITHLVLIGCDTSATVWLPTDIRTNLGDHYYSLMDDNDVWSSDVHVGRFWVQSYSELQGAVRRSILYEREPYTQGGAWFDNALYTAENIDAPDGQYVPSMRHLGRWIFSRLRMADIEVVDTLYADSPQHSEQVRQRVRDLLESTGISVAISRGWLEGCYYQNRAANTGRRNPFVLAITCLSADPVGQGFFRSTSRNNPQGPIASLVIDGFTHTKGNNNMLAWATRGMSYLGLHQPGPIQTLTKYMVFSDLQYADNVLEEEILPTMQAYRLFGDPSVNVFLHQPVALAVEHPEVVTPAATGLNVRVTSGGSPVPDAAVCVWQPGRVHLVAQPGPDGWARFTFASGALAEGTLKVTVTKPDALPYLGAVAVSPAAAVVELRRVEFDGQVFGGGRTVRTTLTLLNSGEADLQNVQVRLSTEFPWVNFDRDTLDIQRLGVNEPEEVSFDMAFNPATPPGEELRVDVQVQAEQTVFPHAFTVTTSGRRLEVVGYDPSDGAFDRGATVTFTPWLRNTGDLASPAVRAVLRSLNSQVRVLDSVVVYPVLAPNQTDDPQQGARFRVQLSNLAIPGSEAQFRLVVSEHPQGEYRDTVAFRRTVGTPRSSDPFGPDEYGYVCFDSYDTGWEKTPTFSWVEINPGKPNAAAEGTRLGINDDFDERDTSVVVRLPFTFRYYGRDFDTVVVCSNGWLAFGAEQSMFVDARNWTIPGAQGPDAQLCVYWDDLFIPDPEFGGVFWHYDPDRGTVTVEWSDLAVFRSREAAPPHPMVECQIVLLDPRRYPTSTGDGEILFLYKNVDVHPGNRTDTEYATIGIKNLDNTGGLQYAWWNHYSERCTPLADSMALLFTVDVTSVVGGVTGRLVLAEDPNQGVGGAAVFSLRKPDDTLAVTDVQGNFTADRVPGGVDILEFRKSGYNPARVNVTVVPDSMISVGVVRMTHPALEVSRETIRRAARPGYGTSYFLPIRNRGNGPLTFRLDRRYPDGSTTAYAEVWKAGVAALTGDVRIYGCEFVGSEIFVTGGNSLNAVDNMIYVIDRQGREVRRFRQPSYGLIGFHDLASDGRYLYGGEDSLIVVFDDQGNRVRDIRVPVPENELPDPLALAYNPSNRTLLAANGYSLVYEITLDGELVRSFRARAPGQLLNIMGMAWNPADNDGLNLYVMDWVDGVGDRRMRLIRVNPETGEGTPVTDLARSRDERGVGLAVGFGWDRDRACLAAVAENRSNDTLRVYEIGPNDGFLSFSPQTGTVGAGGTVQIRMIMESAGLAEGTYRTALLLSHDAAGEPVLLPVEFAVTETTAVEDNGLAPREFGLLSLSPNPFNGRMRLIYALDQPGYARLVVYDIQGRPALVVFDSWAEPGRRQVDVPAEGLPAGTYLVRLESAGRSATAKTVVLK